MEYLPISDIKTIYMKERGIFPTCMKLGVGYVKLRKHLVDNGVYLRGWMAELGTIV
jgi:hypothetical protein